MKKPLFASIAAAVVLLAGADCALGGTGSQFSLSAGARHDEIDWNIAGNTSGSNPNVLSELSWEDLKSFQVKAAARTVVGESLYLRGYADYAWIYDGENQDSDYRADNRGREFLRSNNNADDGDLWDASGAIGLRGLISISDSSLGITPLVGYSYHRQDLRITDGFQTIPPTGPFTDLDSKYEARWHGPWAGLDLEYAMRRFILSGGFEYHLAFFKAEADWNLRTDLAHPKSFEHWADGAGIVGFVNADILLSQNLFLDAEANVQRWDTKHGTDRTFGADGSVTDTQLNEVNWNSYAFLLGVKYVF